MTKYSDLSVEGKAAAREQTRNDPDFYYGIGPDETDLTEQFKFICENDYGMTDLTFSWSLGYCQGDGVAFSGSPAIEEMALKDEYIKTKMEQLETWYFMQYQSISETEYRFKITQEGRYSHSNSMSIEFEIVYGEDGSDQRYKYDEPEAAVLLIERKLREHLEGVVKEVSRRLERDGYALIESYQEDDFLDDYLEANEFEFDLEEEECEV